jgi:phosphoglycolate phosphatase-like HAD superfamily hydrolase
MKPKTIVFDMDGTLTDVSSLRHLVKKGLKDRNFDEFHRRSVDCPPINWVKAHAIMAKELGFTVIQVTARQEKYRPHTSWWLADNRVPSDLLVMRPNGDFRADYEVKKEILNRLLKSYDIVKAFDDNPSIVTLWQELGIPCVVVPGWADD